MKKLFLLAITALAGVTSQAQYAEPLNFMNTGAKQAVQPKTIGGGQPSAKSTIAGSRWYHHGAVISNDVLPGQMEMHLLPIWFDSTVQQRYSTGLGTVNYSSLGQVVDPIHFTLYNDLNIPSNLPNDIAITMQSPYKIDSISFGGYYVENPNRPINVVDTFIFSVATSGNDPETPVQLRFPSVYPWVAGNGYTCGTLCADSTLKGFRIVPTDSINRTSGVSGATVWKVPIDTSFRRPDSAGFVFFKEFTYPVMVNGSPGAVNIPAGRTAGITITFKSGDVSIFGDSITAYHMMYMRSGEALGANQTAGQNMPYYHYTYRDENSSNLMFSTAPAFYAATIIIEGHNTNSFRNEFHDIAAHIVCDNCPTVAEFSSVQNVSSSVGTDMVAYPNPANDDLTVSFIMNQNTNATVSITNAVGQVIDTREVANVIAKENNIVRFSTANLTAGMYFYTVEANGQRTTKRFVVSH